MPWRRFMALLSLALISLGYVVPLSMQPPPGVESWLMFDGVCNLCDGFVNFVADGDSAPPSNRVRFGAQQKHMELLERWLTFQADYERALEEYDAQGDPTFPLGTVLMLRRHHARVRLPQAPP